MLIYLKCLGRYAEINDIIVKEYLKYKDIHENTFIIASYFAYPDGLEALSDDELSVFCNKTLVEDLEIACNAAISAMMIDKCKENNLGGNRMNKAKNVNNSIVKNNDAVNPAVKEAILTGHDKFGEAMEKLAEGEEEKKTSSD